MPDLAFDVESAHVVPHAASPLLALRVSVTNHPSDEEVQAILLTYQVRVDVERRSYGPAEKAKLGDLFGQPALWGRSLRGFLWALSTASVPSFRGSTFVDLLLPCSLDLSVAWTKYFYALEAGEVPLTLLFSGTIFHVREERLQVAPIPWDREATFRLKVSVWRDMLAAYYPDAAFLSLRSDVLERLYEYKVKNGLPSWEHAIERLLGQGGA